MIEYAKPGEELMALAEPLRKHQAPFSNEIDWTGYELWHHEGWRARHGVAMMAPDYTHWHGTYEVAKRFYAELIPGLESMVAANESSPRSIRSMSRPGVPMTRSTPRRSASICGSIPTPP